MDLILKCIDNHPQSRAHTGEIVERLSEMVLQFPASFANQLEMLRHIEADEEEKKTLREEGKLKRIEILSLMEQTTKQSDKTLTQERKKIEAEIDKVNEVSRRLVVKNHDLQSRINSLQCTVSTLKADIARKDSEISRRDSTIEKKMSDIEEKSRALQQKDTTISGMSEQLARTKTYLTTGQQVSIIVIM